MSNLNYKPNLAKSLDFLQELKKEPKPLHVTNDLNSVKARMLSYAFSIGAAPGILVGLSYELEKVDEYRA